MPENLNVFACSAVGTAALGAGAGANVDVAGVVLGRFRPRLRLRLRRLPFRRRSRLRLRLRPRFLSLLAAFALADNAEVDAAGFLPLVVVSACAFVGEVVSVFLAVLLSSLGDDSGADVATAWVAAGAALLASLAVESGDFLPSVAFDGADPLALAREPSFFLASSVVSFFSLALRVRCLDVRGLDDCDRDRDLPLRALRLRRRLDRSSFLELRGDERLRDADDSDPRRRRWLRLLFLSFSRWLFLLDLRFRRLPRSREREEPEDCDELADRERLRPRAADRDRERARRWLRFFLASALTDRLRLRLRSRRRLRLLSRSDLLAASVPISAPFLLIPRVSPPVRRPSLDSF